MTAFQYIRTRLDEIADHGRKARLFRFGRYSFLIIREAE